MGSKSFEGILCMNKNKSFLKSDLVTRGWDRSKPDGSGVMVNTLFRRINKNIRARHGPM